MTTGTTDKIKGKTNEVVGGITGNRDQEMKGKMQQGVGNVKDAARDAKDKLTGEE